jgi:hypothetical protein
MEAGDAEMIGSVELNLAEAVFYNALEAIIITDLEGRIISLNRSSELLLGYSHKDLRGTPLHKLLYDEEDGGNLVSRIIRDGTVANRRLKCYRKDGKMMDVNLTASLLRDRNGLPQGTIAILKDITREVQAEEEIREYISQMKDYVRQVENLNILKDLFTDILRHDLINPVTVIKNVSAALLADNSISSDKRLKIELIKRNVDKLEKIIENATLYGKLESMSDLPLYKEDLWLIVDKARSSVEWMAEDKGIKIKFSRRRAARAHINPILEEAFANLLSNAVKYSPPASTVHVNIASEGNTWRVCVADEGEGIPDEYKQIIFERFERGGKKGVKGSGLGLAIVKRIVDLHKGEVWVEDNKPRGSRFYVRLPKKL